jgi:hypothetical protein
MRKADRFRFANELRAWIEVVDGGIVNHSQVGQGCLGSTTLRIGPGSITFRAMALPDLRPTPEVSETSVRFMQTAGGRTGVAAPRYVDHPPYLTVTPPVVWTILALTIRADGSSDYEMVGASPFPRHWIYDHSGRHVANSGLIQFRVSGLVSGSLRLTDGAASTRLLSLDPRSPMSSERSPTSSWAAVQPSNVWKQGRSSYRKAISATSYSS